MEQELFYDERDYEAANMDYNCVIDDDEYEEEEEEEAPENNCPVVTTQFGVAGSIGKLPGKNGAAATLQQAIS